MLSKSLSKRALLTPALTLILALNVFAHNQALSGLEIRNASTTRGEYLPGETILFSLDFYNSTDRDIMLNGVTVTLSELITNRAVIKKSRMISDVRIPAHQSFKLNQAKLIKVPLSIQKGPVGIFLDFTTASTAVHSQFLTFFRVIDANTLTCFKIRDETYKGAKVFKLDGGMSAEYAIEKAAEGLIGGISHSWKVNGRGSGPNQVYATPQFLANSVNRCVGFYDKVLGRDRKFNTVIISTGIPSVPYLSNVMQAPVLPLHFLVSANTTKEIQSIMDYSKDHGYFSYSTLGYDASVPSASVAWVKLLDLPKPYVEFLKRHKVENLVILGATGSTGGETMAKLLNLPSGRSADYQPGSMYLLYPQGGVAEDEQAFKEKLTDYQGLDLKKPLVRIADWESGIIEEQVKNFSSTARRNAGIKNIRFITADDDGDLYNLATYATAAFFYKNNLLPVKGVILNPYLISNPFYESRYGYLPFVYWQGNTVDNIWKNMLSAVNGAIAAYFPGLRTENLNVWLNSSLNFGGPDREKLLRQNISASGLKRITLNNLSVDEVWDLSDGINAPCELKFKKMVEQYPVSTLRRWHAGLLQLTPTDLDELGKKFPIKVTNR